jgi:hypothetical protein
MAARTSRTSWNDKWRDRIDAAMLLKRLTEHVVGTTEMSPSQISAAKILLNKVAPDLKAIELTGADGGPVQVAVNVRFVEPDGY